MAMAQWVVRPLAAAVVFALVLSSVACQRSESDRVEAVAEDLKPWIDPDDLSGEEKEVWKQFCRLLATERSHDRGTEQERMVREETRQKVQPLIEEIAAKGEPAEDLMIRLLTGRQDRTREVGQGVATDATPETYARAVLWNLWSEEVEEIAAHLEPWIDPADLSAEEKAVWKQFCRFLAFRRFCDQEIAAVRITSEDAVHLTQPVIDEIAAQGEPTEDLMIRLLKKRQSMTREERRKTMLDEGPEIFATIVLWTMRSKEAVPLLMELATDLRFENRAVFVRALGRIGDPQALGLLQDLGLNEPDPKVRLEAQEAISEIDSQLQKETEP